MKRNPIVKLFALLLTVCALLSTAAAGIGCAVMVNKGLYEQTPDYITQDEYYAQARRIATRYLDLYVSKARGNCSDALLRALYGEVQWESTDWSVTVFRNGEILHKSPRPAEHSYSAEFEFTAWYYEVVHQAVIDETEGFSESNPTTVQTNGTIAATVPESGSSGVVNYDRKVYVWEENELRCYWLRQQPATSYIVSVLVSDAVLEGTYTALLLELYPYRYTFVIVLVLSLLVLIAGITLLCSCAGHAKDGTIRPGGLNRLPLDLYAFAVFLGAVLLLSVIDRYLPYNNTNPVFWIGTAAGCLAVLLGVIGFIAAFAAQVKGKTGFWWRHSITGLCLIQLVRLLKWLLKGLQKLLRAVDAMVRLLPVTWQWLLTALAMGLVLLITGIAAATSPYQARSFFTGLFLLSIFGCIGMVLYGGYAFGLLISGAKKMAQGSLHHRVPTKYLLGSFRDFATALNSLSDAVTVAAQNQLRSERMKTELITNVSHDIKTPLTSIINYVDLLQKVHTPEQETEYLDVLSRQSQQMKRLIEDLMELSKASTGNMNVQIDRVDLAESVTQALGEFSDKLAAARLTTVFRKPDAPLWVQGDGRLIWRVLSNLLNNAVKYAMPDTRLYLELVSLEGQVFLSLKNISREELQLTAEELMERFVQGDASRNQEGSGLGLNIAKSLMEVQHGQLTLTLDGDLFKVTLTLPQVREEG